MTLGKDHEALESGNVGTDPEVQQLVKLQALGVENVKQKTRIHLPSMFFIFIFDYSNFEFPLQNIITFLKHFFIFSLAVHGLEVEKENVQRSRNVVG